MSGTWPQSGTYGPNPEYSRPAGDGSAAALLEAVRALPAVAAARDSKCEWVVATTLFAHKPGSLRPPASHAPTKAHCWLAFVDRLEHRTPGWTAVKLAIFPELERGQNIVKVMLPAVLERPSIYVDYTITTVRCIALPHLIREPVLVPDRLAAKPLHMLASKIPGWSSRSKLTVQIELMRDFVRKGRMTASEAQLDELESRMQKAGFNASSGPYTAQGGLCDTMYAIFPVIDAPALQLSRLWFAEVALHSAFEKPSFSWVASQVEGLRYTCGWAEYVYSSEQRCKCTNSTLQHCNNDETKTKAALQSVANNCYGNANGEAHHKHDSLEACCERQAGDTCGAQGSILAAAFGQKGPESV